MDMALLTQNLDDRDQTRQKNAIVSEAEEIVNNALNGSDGQAGAAALSVCRRFPRNTALPACCCTSRRCPRLTVSVMWDRRRSPGTTALPQLAHAVGRRCRSVPQVTVTRRINPCRLSLGTDCSSVRTG